MSTQPFDDDRFNAFINRSYDAARAAARSDDFLHDAIIELRKIRLFNPDHPSARGFLGKKVRWLRASEARKRRPSQLPEGYDRASPELPPDEAAISKEFQKRVCAALSALPGRERAVIEAKIAGKSVEETAAELGITVREVYALTFKARVKLREMLDEP